METMYAHSSNIENEYNNMLYSLHNELDSLELQFSSIISFRNNILFKFIIKIFHNLNLFLVIKNIQYSFNNFKSNFINRFIIFHNLNLFLVIKNIQYSLNNFKSNFINRIQITRKSKLLYTPVAKTKKSSGPCSKTDWEEQIIRHNNNQQMMWDDSPTNKSNVGDVFATIFNSEKVDFYIITHLLPSNNRLTSWSNNVGQTNRQVLYISSLNYSINWDQWIQISNYSSSFKCQGTKNAGETTRRNIITHLLNHI